MGGGFVVRKEYGQKCEWGTKIVPCAIIYTGAKTCKEIKEILLQKVDIKLIETKPDEPAVNLCE